MQYFLSKIDLKAILIDYGTIFSKFDIILFNTNFVVMLIEDEDKTFCRLVEPKESATSSEIQPCNNHCKPSSLGKGKMATHPKSTNRQTRNLKRENPHPETGFDIQRKKGNKILYLCSRSFPAATIALASQRK